MRLLHAIFFSTAVIALSLGLMMQNPAHAAGALYDAQEKNTQQMVVQIDGTISDKLQQDNIYFISGDFSEAKLNDGPLLERNNLIILNLKDKRFAYWQIDTNGPVYDMEILNNLLFIGGSFDQVDGVEQKNLAVFDIESQRLLSDVTGTNFPVNTFAQYENTVFLGGAFTRLVDAQRLRLASYDTDTKTILAWNPQLNGTVNDMVVYENRLYVVGDFTEVNGMKRTYSASFSLPEGELTAWAAPADGSIREITIVDGDIVLRGDKDNTFSAELDTSDVDTVAVPSKALTQEEKIEDGLSIHVEEFGFKIPTLGDLLTFAIRAFFAIAGLAALFYLLRGALAWITSGGDKDSVAEARNRIQAAIIGLIMIVAVLAIVWTLEQVIFNRKICLGLSCPLTLPSLLEPNSN